jgi:hypothetical protein
VRLKKAGKRSKHCKERRAAGKVVVAFAAMGVSFLGWAGESETKLRVNPFLRPAPNDAAPRPTEASGPLRSTAPPSRLRFTLAAGPESLVHVDGKTLRIGEEINGYRLEAVRADGAIFTNGEQVVELKIRPEDLRQAK